MYKEIIDELEIQITLDEQFSMTEDEYMNFKNEFEELITKYRI